MLRVLPSRAWRAAAAWRRRRTPLSSTALGGSCSCTTMRARASPRTCVHAAPPLACPRALLSPAQGLAKPSRFPSALQLLPRVLYADGNACMTVQQHMQLHGTPPRVEEVLRLGGGVLELLPPRRARHHGGAFTSRLTRVWHACASRRGRGASATRRRLSSCLATAREGARLALRLASFIHAADWCVWRHADGSTRRTSACSCASGVATRARRSCSVVRTEWRSALHSTTASTLAGSSSASRIAAHASVAICSCAMSNSLNAASGSRASLLE